MSLGEITSAEKLGVPISGPDKMTTSVQNAAMSGRALPQPQCGENGGRTTWRPDMVRTLNRGSCGR